MTLKGLKVYIIKRYYLSCTREISKSEIGKFNDFT